MPGRLRHVSTALISELGDVLVRVEGGTQNGDELLDEYGAVLKDFERDHRTKSALLKMSWVARKAIARCHALEGGSDVGVDRADRGDGRHLGDDVHAAVARPAQRSTTGSSAA